MQSLPLNRRRFGIIQALIIVVALALLSLQSGLRAPSELWVSNTGDGSLDLKFAGLAGTGGAVAASAALQTTLSPPAAFDALNDRAGGTLDVRWDAEGGIPRWLTGNGRTVRIPYTPTAAEQGNPLAIARGFLDENRALFRLNAVATDFGPGRLEPDRQLGFAHVRLPQMYNGIPVFGRQLIVHLDAREQITAVNGDYAPGLNVPSQPTISREDAEQLALDNLKEVQLEPDERARVQADVLEEKTALTVYVDAGGKATLTWGVRVLTTSPLGEWTFFVNARRPVVVHSFDEVGHAKFRRTYSARNGTDIPGRLLVEEGERTSDAIAQAAHDGAGRVYDYYFNTFQRDGIDDQGSPMVSTVHWGSDPQEAENAAWIGEAFQMVYGDGGELFEPLAYGLDVVGHEFTHGVVDSSAQLIYEGQSGALNESYADIFGAMIDRENWTLGEEVVKSPPYPLPYLRSLEDPEAEGSYDPSQPLSGIGQPGDMDGYANLPISRRADYGGVHINSGIPNHAAFFVAQAITKEKMEQIYYRALTQYLSPTSDFFDAGQATVRAATDLYGQQEVTAVRNAFRQVGIDLGGPETVPTAPTPGATAVAGPTALPSPPIETLPAGCRDVIVNGGFEGNSGWTQRTAGDTALIDPELPRTGSQSAWLGGTDKEAFQYIYQDVPVPANARSARLSYYRLVHEEFEGVFGLLGAEDANFTALLADTEGNEIARLEEVSSAGGNDRWQQMQFDLSRYAGKTVRVVFAAENPRGNVSSFFVDDARLAACSTGQGPSAPPTSSSDQVYIEGRILNADTRRGIEGAQIFILRQGLSTSSAAADDEITDDEVAAFGTTDASGSYQTEDPVTRNRTYSVIIVARGYRPVLADNGVRLPADATNPTQVNAVMRRGR